ncbi:secretion protein EspD [Mycobacterium kyorinense]|uniref:Secretion protein EspD n=1 Tax=Mycobacterium kyorinense TaxID=487514 RepID=A0A1A2Z9R3_9MYCO|nr:secretion protein EspD [Mycobacterium kyorinense]OBI46388.1 secretion protein EspD [Mycobacterium kyorinense]
MDGTPPYPLDGDDDRDDLAALDFSVGYDDGEESVLGVFDDYLPSEETDADDDWPAIAARDMEEEELQSPLFTVTNPAGTVTVSAFMDGHIQGIELTAKVTNMTEAHLADEILVIADLARQKARSAQYESISEAMRELGQDNATTRDFLTRELRLPSPEEATAAAAKVFATRYASDHD